MCGTNGHNRPSCWHLERKEPRLETEEINTQWLMVEPMREEPGGRWARRALDAPLILLDSQATLKNGYPGDFSLPSGGFVQCVCVCTSGCRINVAADNSVMFRPYILLLAGSLSRCGWDPLAAKKRRRGRVSLWPVA